MVAPVGRIFAAVPLPPEVRLALEQTLEGLEIPGKLVPPENWHLTLRFLGSVDEVAYERFLSWLTRAEERHAFPVHLDHIGAFPKPKRATVVWVGLDRGVEDLSTLNAVAEEAAQAAGLPGEERPYHPHLTLARVRPPQDVTGLTATELDLGWMVNRVVVFRSRLGRGGPRYEPLETFELLR
ncbi:MAG: RNA 2',3'-cyclic phosphodiesterase [Acidimicrobiia bacterium]